MFGGVLGGDLAKRFVERFGTGKTTTIYAHIETVVAYLLMLLVLFIATPDHEVHEVRLKRY